MNYNTNNIDISLLKVYSNDLENEKNSFNLVTYNTFKSSNLYNINNKYIKSLVKDLEKTYKKIEAEYVKIGRFLNDYISNVESLEKSLVNNVGISKLDSNIRNYVESNIGELK